MFLILILILVVIWFIIDIGYIIVNIIGDLVGIVVVVNLLNSLDKEIFRK